MAMNPFTYGDLTSLGTLLFIDKQPTTATGYGDAGFIDKCVVLEDQKEICERATDRTIIFVPEIYLIELSLLSLNC
jgi:hypothetical protein